MPTPAERRALIFIAGIATLGAVARGWREVRGDRADDLVAGDRAGLSRQIAAVDSAIAAGGARRAARPERVRTQKKGGAPGPASVTGDAPERPERPPEYPPRARFPKSWVSPEVPDVGVHHDAARRTSQPGSGGPPRQDRRDDSSKARARVGVSGRAPSARITPPVDLDVASLDEIASVPQIGAGLARQIVRDRVDRGPFGSIDGLRRIPGISAGLARRLQPFVTFSLAVRTGDAPAEKKGRRPGR